MAEERQSLHAKLTILLTPPPDTGEKQHYPIASDEDSAGPPRIKLNHTLSTFLKEVLLQLQKNVCLSLHMIFLTYVSGTECALSGKANTGLLCTSEG